jgi:mannose-6-phosphate isomerase-like protein (cupin superfamily)
MKTSAFAGFLALSLPAAQVIAAELLYEKNILLDNEQVHVFEARYKSGGASEHTHDYSRVVYVLQGGVLELAKSDGTAKRKELTPGKVVWRPAETHTVTNVGDSVVRLVEIEVKR